MNDKLMSEKEEAIGGFGLSLSATIPQDAYIADLEIIATPLAELPWDSPLPGKVKEVANLLQL